MDDFSGCGYSGYYYCACCYWDYLGFLGLFTAIFSFYALTTWTSFSSFDTIFDAFFFFFSSGLSSPPYQSTGFFFSFLFSLLYTDPADTFSLLRSFSLLLIIDYSASPFFSSSFDSFSSQPAHLF